MGSYVRTAEHKLLMSLRFFLTFQSQAHKDAMRKPKLMSINKHVGYLLYVLKQKKNVKKLCYIVL